MSKTNGTPITGTQVRLLKALSKTPAGLTGSELAAKAEVHPTAIGNQAGYRDPEINKREVHAGVLSNRGYVTIKEVEDRGYVYAITAAGRKALTTAEKAPKAEKK